MRQSSLYLDFVETRLGAFQIAASSRGLTAIKFPTRHQRPAERAPAPRKVLKTLERVKVFLIRFLAAEKVRPPQVLLDWNGTSSFERKVLETLRRIPFGSLVTYGELAGMSGARRAGRAVGNALRKNRFPLLIPCHRVIRKDRSLGGFQSGLHWKRKLIKLEQNSAPRKQQT